MLRYKGLRALTEFCRFRFRLSIKTSFPVQEWVTTCPMPPQLPINYYLVVELMRYFRLPACLPDFSILLAAKSSLTKSSPAFKSRMSRSIRYINPAPTTLALSSFYNHILMMEVQHGVGLRKPKDGTEQEL